jgi:hypothetical protein
MTSVSGSVLVKEWERSRNIGYLAGATCDRYVSGDRTARFMDRAELLTLLTTGVPTMSVIDSATVRRSACNALVALRGS